MGDTDQDFEQAYGSAAAPATPTTLALFILLLAFFIVLYSVALRDESRTLATMESIGLTFREQRAPDPGAGGVPALGRSAMPDRFGQAVAAALPEARLEPEVGGTALIVRVPAHSIFRTGDSALASRATLVPRLATLMQQAPGDLDGIEIQAGAEPGGPDLALTRAAVLAQTLAAAGEPADRLAITRSTAQPATLVLRFVAGQATQPR
ncbi:hypothetical protein [Zavarzinia sp. CC-PAN008]|uniref:hypothetical protein n=1 Tax=Zavarzinia sp. CC-PAN008 TaxID=3243332 RepID=UPI003F749475